MVYVNNIMCFYQMDRAKVVKMADFKIRNVPSFHLSIRRLWIARTKSTHLEKEKVIISVTGRIKKVVKCCV